tara:strand:- start:9226 stop:9750 length:525 start_codon:yes stop_codon:yes gene_type:complete
MSCNECRKPTHLWEERDKWGNVLENKYSIDISYEDSHNEDYEKVYLQKYDNDRIPRHVTFCSQKCLNAHQKFLREMMFSSTVFENREDKKAAQKVLVPVSLIYFFVWYMADDWSEWTFDFVIFLVIGLPSIAIAVFLFKKELQEGTINEQIALTVGLLVLIAILTFVALFVSWF